MKKPFAYKHTGSLLMTCLFLASCNGQVNTNKPEKTVTASTVVAGQPKMVKTQGSDRYASTRCGLQDKNGNLWFGTVGEGVYRYDGKNFVQFTLKDGLSHNTVWSMVEDKMGNIWFGTDAGICRYDRDQPEGKEKTIVSVPIVITGDNSSFSYVSSNNVLPAKYNVWSMLKDRNGKLWFGTSEGVFCYDGNVYTRFPDNGVSNPSGIQLKSIQYIMEDKNGKIWFCPGASQAGPDGLEGLCCYDGKSITSYKPNGDGWIRTIVEDKDGVFWMGTRHNGNWRYDGKTYTQYTDKEGIGAPRLVDKAGRIWFSGDEHDNGYEGSGGVWCYDARLKDSVGQGKTFLNFTTEDGMGNYGVWSITEDKEGNIWFGTRNNGLYRYDGKNFTCFSE